METRLKENELGNIKFKCGMDNIFVVDCTGQGRERAGGIALLWRENL